MNTRKSFSVLSLAAMAVFFALSATAKGFDLMDMTDELDKMDREDLLVLLDKANGCTRQRNFSCSEEQLRKAGKLVHDSSDKLALNKAKQNLQTEKNRVEQESRDKAERERQIRLAEEREAERARERAWEEERERRFAREEEEENDRQSNAQAWAQVLGQVNADMSAFNRQMADQNKEIDRLVGQGKQQKRDEQAARIREENERRERERNERIARDEMRDKDEQRKRRLSESRQQDQARQQAEDQRVENARKDEQARKQEQTRREEQARRDAQTRKDELARKNAEAEATRLAEKIAEQQAKASYLNSMRSGIRLGATSCPGGEGSYFATGTMPRMKQAVSCIDVSYRAYCQGSAVYSRGVAKNFVGMSGCFGDTYEISPKPACPVAQVRVEVTDVRPCN